MMLLKKYLFLLAFATLLSCGKDAGSGDTGGDDDPDGKITQEQLSNLNNTCMTEANTLQLPTPLTLLENYSTDEYASQVWLTSTICRSIISTFGNTLLPSTLATAAASDGLNVFSGEEAYTWGVAPEKYIYIKKDDGYQILQFNSDSDILGSEKIRVRQNDDCTDFEIVQRATAEDVGLELGEIVFRMAYVNQNMQQYDFSNLGDGDNLTYSMRSFNDLSGDLRITDTSTNKQTSIIWNVDGDGSWELIEDNISVESGTWSF